jgi:hypothetical protein
VKQAKWTVKLLIAWCFCCGRAVSAARVQVTCTDLSFGSCSTGLQTGQFDASQMHVVQPHARISRLGGASMVLLDTDLLVMDGCITHNVGALDA